MKVWPRKMSRMYISFDRSARVSVHFVVAINRGYSVLCRVCA